MEDFNELEWINQFFDNAVDLQQNKDFEHIKNFALFWNMFENFACRNYANAERIKRFVEKLKETVTITDAFINPFLEYFIARYTQNGTINIEGLQFRNNLTDIESKAKVIRVLSQQAETPIEIVEALLLIILRLRNNLFHGNKRIININNQIPNFAIANRFLAEILNIGKQNYLIII